MDKEQAKELDALRQRLGMVPDPTLAERQWNRALAAQSPFVRRALAHELPVKELAR